MASTYTPAGIELIADGEQSGTWGQTTNTNWELVEELATGVVSISLTGLTTYTLTTTDGTSTEGRHAVVKFTGSPGGTCTVTVSPNDMQKIYWIVNASDQSVVMTQGSGGNVTVLADSKKVMYCDGAGAGAAVVDLSQDLDIHFMDGDKLTFGDSADLEIYHDGSNSIINDAGTGNLKLQLGGSDKLEVTSAGVAVTGTVDVTSVEATNLKAKDGTASATIADSTGVMTIASSVLTTTDINGGTIDGVTIGGSSAGAITGTTITGTSFVTSGDMTFGDNDKAIFGAGSDLQIYHNGTESFILDNGTGPLLVRATDLYLQKHNGEIYIACVADGSVSLRYDDSTKLATTSTGVDITGTLTSDGLTVDGDVTLGNGATLNIDDQDSIVFGTYSGGSTGTLLQGGTSTDYSIRVAGRLRQNISTGGDISFYEDTGTTPKFFWDASAESLGIGTSSPNRALHVLSSGSEQATFASSGSSAGINFQPSGATVDHNRILVNSNQMLFIANNAERMRIDSSGNVGVGVVPKTGGSAWQHIQFGGTGNLLARHSDTTVGSMFANNYYVNSSDVDSYIATGASARMFLDGDVFKFSQAASGTADAAITWSEAMRIDSSGNVGIGTSSPSASYKLHVAGSIIVDSSSILNLNGTSTAADPQLLLGQGGVGIFRPASDVMGFSTNDTERMRIDSSGYILVGKTTTSDSVEGTRISQNGAMTQGSNGTSAHDFHDFYRGTAGSLVRVGNIRATGSSTAYNTSSDYRLKEDWQPMSGSIDRLKNLNPVNFAWKVSGERVDGFLAHEAAEVVPEAVTGEKDAMRTEEYEVTPAVLDDDGNVVTEAVMGTREVPDYQGIDQAKLVPLLTAALQEAVSKIEALETRIAALEA